MSCRHFYLLNYLRMQIIVLASCLFVMHVTTASLKHWGSLKFTYYLLASLIRPHILQNMWLKKTSNYRICSNNIWYLLIEIRQRAHRNNQHPIGMKCYISIPKEEKIDLRLELRRLSKASSNSLSWKGFSGNCLLDLCFSSLINIWQYLI